MLAFFTQRAEKQVRKVPKHIQKNLWLWVATVMERGNEEARKIPGYHGEQLKGQREGQRSIRLSWAYRAIYEEPQFEERSGDTNKNDEGKEVVLIDFISVEEVNKHDYETTNNEVRVSEIGERASVVLVE